MLAKRLAILGLWAAFTVYAFFFAPPDDPEATRALIARLLVFDNAGINPVIVALFNLMGVWPLLYLCVTLIDGRGQRLPAWLFSAASFGVGIFALGPYLALRDPNPTFPGEKTWLLRLLDSRWLGALLAVGAIALAGYGIVAGNWGDFWQQFQHNRFINVMSLDFCLLALLFPTLLADDMRRRGMDPDTHLFRAVSLAPLVGPALYLCVRSPLPAATTSSEPAVGGTGL